MELLRLSQVPNNRHGKGSAFARWSRGRRPPGHLEGRASRLARDRAMAEPVGLDRLGADAAAFVGLVVLEVAGGPFDVAFAFEGEDVRGQAGVSLGPASAHANPRKTAKTRLMVTMVASSR